MSKAKAKKAVKKATSAKCYVVVGYNKFSKQYEGVVERYKEDAFDEIAEWDDLDRTTVRVLELELPLYTPTSATAPATKVKVS
jgi:hypothetical protein